MPATGDNSLVNMAGHCQLIFVGSQATRIFQQFDDNPSAPIGPLQSTIFC
ncbi:hypothetical protein [Asticcacaulis taihuensis]